MCEFISPPTHFAWDYSRSCCRVFRSPKFVASKQLQARQTADDIIRQGNKEAENIKKKSYLKQKEENQILREQTESELRERRGELQNKKPDFFKRGKFRSKI